MNNSTDIKPLWPQTPEGTTDWDVVFEDPTNGFIAIISKAQTPEALQQTTSLVIKKLFTRDDDGPEVERFCAQLDQIISSVEQNDQLTAMIEAIAGLLRTIKDERKEKAREYLENKKIGIEAGERRTRRKKNTLAAKIFRGLLAASDPKIALPSILLLMAVVVTAVIYFASPQTTTPRSEIAMTRQQDMRSPPATDPQTGASIEETIADAPPPVDEVDEVDEVDGLMPEEESDNSSIGRPRAVLLQPMQWPLIRERKKDPIIAYATIIYVKSSAAVSAICINYPAVKESLLISFGKIGLLNRQPNETELKKIAAIATMAINKRVGPAVEYVDIVKYGQKGYRATNTPPCRLAR